MLIITGSDNNYAIGVMTLIASAALHNPNARFAVLDLDISEENRARIDALGARLNVEIIRHEIDSKNLSDLPIFSEHVTVSTFLRLLIPQLFPKEDRAIYMDCDMLCAGSLRDLWETDLKDNLIAAVRDVALGRESFLMAECAATGVDVDDYINAGLLLIDLQKWRYEKIDNECLQLIKDGTMQMADQSAINIACRGRKHKLPQRFNLMKQGKNGFVRDSKDVPVVLHFTGNKKPWEASSMPLARVWIEYASILPDLIPSPKVHEKKKSAIYILNYKRKLLGYRLFNPTRYQRITDMKKIEAELLAGLKVVTKAG